MGFDKTQAWKQEVEPQSDTSIYPLTPSLNLSATGGGLVRAPPFLCRQPVFLFVHSFPQILLEHLLCSRPVLELGV